MIAQDNRAEEPLGGLGSNQNNIIAYYQNDTDETPRQSSQKEGKGVGPSRKRFCSTSSDNDK